jgi:ubiquinone/menaquinone biosynthesis C-methylase UbiE
MEKQDIAAGFGKVDRMADSQFFIRFVDNANAMESVQDCKRKILSLLNVREGDVLLDVGCGTGDDGRMLAQMVGDRGRVVGVDSSGVMIAEARRRAEGSNLGVEFHLGDAHHLNFSNNTFDGCRTERTFMHVDDPSQLLAEMIRVARSGTRIVVFDFDWDAVVINSPDRSLTRKIVRMMSDSVRQGWIGRRLPALFRESGLREIAIIPTPYPRIRPTQLAPSRSELARDKLFRGWP